MSLIPLLLALQGIGFALTPIALAVQGLLAGADAEPTDAPTVFRPGVVAQGPGTTISLADYLKQFGPPTTATPVRTTQTPAQRAAAQRKKRQRMEDETLALAATVFE